jgi:hypothetical protein
MNPVLCPPPIAILRIKQSVRYITEFAAGTPVQIDAQKKARWWNRLGGKPVCHAASPRFVSCLMQHYIIHSKQRKTLTTLNKAVK